jgi:hypothetical protein
MIPIAEPNFATARNALTISELLWYMVLVKKSKNRAIYVR